jgi:hypothetical protein
MQREVRITGERGVVCPAGLQGTIRTPRSQPTRLVNLSAMESAAVTDLAMRLQVPASSIRVTRRVPQTWPDSTLNCATPFVQSTPASGSIAGFRLVLRQRDRAFTYHTDMTRVMACPPIEEQ